MKEENQQLPERHGWFRGSANLALWGFLLIAGFFLFSEHRAHVFGLLPYLLLLACLLLHLFMHRGHGKEGHHPVERKEEK